MVFRAKTKTNYIATGQHIIIIDKCNFWGWYLIWSDKYSNIVKLSFFSFSLTWMNYTDRQLTIG